MIADTARTRYRQVTWLDTTSDELLDELRVLNGYDTDLAVDVTRTASRLRDILCSVSPAFERLLGDRLAHPAACAILGAHPPQLQLRAAGPTVILRLAVAHAPRVGTRLANDIGTALDAQTLTLPAETAKGKVITDLARELERLHQRREDLATEIEAVFNAHPFGPLLASIPGIGARTGDDPR